MAFQAFGRLIMLVPCTAGPILEESDPSSTKSIPHLIVTIYYYCIGNSLRTDIKAKTAQFWALCRNFHFLDLAAIRTFISFKEV
jgi:hypothetical protein